jgi:hypothetical protein
MKRRFYFTLLVLAVLLLALPGLMAKAVSRGSAVRRARESAGDGTVPARSSPDIEPRHLVLSSV